MEIDITALVNAHRAGTRSLKAFSASIAETGNPNAGRDTWNAANVAASAKPLLKTHAECDAARKYFKGFGAWSADELAAMTDTEINALTLQHVAADIRELDRYRTIREYQKAADRGTVSGNVYKSGRRFYFYLGN